MRARVFAAGLIASVVLACGGGHGGAGGGSGGSGGDGGSEAGHLDAGSVTTSASGRITGTRTDPGFLASYGASTDTTQLAFAVGGDSFHASFAVTFSSPPDAGSYDSSSPGFRCLLGASDPQTLAGWQTHVNDPGVADAGDCSAQITSVGGSEPNTGDSTLYVVHGSVQGSAVAHTAPATGTIGLDFKF